MSASVENPTSSLDQIRRVVSPANPQEAAESKDLAKQIAGIAPRLIGRSRYEAMPEGHLRTFTAGEETVYDTVRRLPVRVLQVAVEESRRYRTSDGIEEIAAKVVVGPFDAPRTVVEAKTNFTGGGVATRTSSHLSTPHELKAILGALTNGSPTDPRPSSWTILTSL